MVQRLTSERIQLDGFLEAMEYFHREGWTDGLPVVPPTEELVQSFLEYVGLNPDLMIGEYADRARAITAEKLATNAVMAGCKQEYMPILVAACTAITKPQFSLNHLASMASPWPLLIINGPQVKDLGFNSGAYVFGPGARANATVGRALSLVLANCMEARPGGIQRGSMGHAARFGFCIAENEDTPWEPLHVEKGFDRNDNVVTVFPSGAGPTNLAGPDYPFSALQWAEKFTRTLANARYHFCFGTYVLVLPPPVQQVFVKDGWSKQDIRQYIMENSFTTVANLKVLGSWQYMGTDDGKPPTIKPDDETRKVYLFKRESWYEAKAWELSRQPDILIVIAGGDVGSFGAVVEPYPVAAEPVSQRVEPGAMQNNNNK